VYILRDFCSSQITLIYTDFLLYRSQTLLAEYFFAHRNDNVVLMSNWYKKYKLIRQPNNSNCVAIDLPVLKIVLWRYLVWTLIV
jgi:hypothetical protein